MSDIPRTDNADDGIVGSARRVRRSAEDLRKERLAFLGTLAAGLAHEIRSPLEAIKLNAELIEEDASCIECSKNADFANRIERIKREAEQLKNTLDEFLRFARPPRMERFPTRINKYVAELIDFVKLEFDAAGIAIVTDFQDDLYPLPVDQAQLGQALMNILANAREAIGEHGEVRISTRDIDDMIEIRISDNGGGVPEDQVDKIFEVFYTTKERGTGLGLGIAHRVVEEHGGSLILENRPGAGATFVIRLPKGKFLEYDDIPSMETGR